LTLASTKSESFKSSSGQKSVRKHKALPSSPVHLLPSPPPLPSSRSLTLPLLIRLAVYESRRPLARGYGSIDGLNAAAIGTPATEHLSTGGYLFGADVFSQTEVEVDPQGLERQWALERLVGRRRSPDVADAVPTQELLWQRR
jgi:hypothetical protein